MRHYLKAAPHRSLPLSGLLCALVAMQAANAETGRLMAVRQIPSTVWEQTGQTPITMVCPRVAAGPELDGELGDACWEQAGQAGLFLKCDDNIAIDLPAQVPTEVRFCRDDANLFFAWKLHGEEAERQARLVESGKASAYSGRGAGFVIILEPPDAGEWLRWSFEPTGAYSTFSQSAGKAYEAPCRTAAAAFDGGANVEIAIPFDSPRLGAPEQGEWWRMQFGRVDNHEWTAYPNSRGIFEQPVRFGYLLFDDLEKAETARAPVPPGFELYGERYAYDADRKLTQFIAATTGVPLEGRRLRFTLLGGDTTIASIDTEDLAHPKVAVTADLAGLEPGQYRLRGEIVRDGQVPPDAPAGEWAFELTERAVERSPFPETGIALNVHEQLDQPGATWPVATAVPLPYGAVADVSTLAVYEDGHPIPANLVARSYWDPVVNAAPELASRSGGGIKWVGVAFNVRYDGKIPRTYVLRRGRGAPPASPLALTRDGDRMTLTTGPARFSFDGRHFAGIDAAWRDRNADGAFTENEQHIAAGGGAYLVDNAGTRYDAARCPAEVTIEEQGPARIVLVVKGWYQAENGERLCLSHSRLSAYAGLPWLRVDQRTILTFDTRLERLRDLGFTVALPKARACYLGMDADAAASAAMTAPYWSLRVHQDRHNHFRVLDASGENAEQATPIFKHEGYRARGWAAFRDAAGNRTEVVLRDFWQKFPKELEASQNGITLHFWPSSGEDTFSLTEELQRAHFSKLRFAHEGEAMELQIPRPYADCFEAMATREYVNLHECIYPGLGSNGQGLSIANSFLIGLRTPGEADAPSIAALFQRDPQAFADPVYACATRVLGPMRHRDVGRYPYVERLLDHGYLFVKRYFEQTGSWGMFNTYDMFSQPLPVTRYPSTYRMWMNAHHQQPETAWLMYFRSGSPQWLEWARGYSDHFMNIDTCNYDDPENPMIGTTPDGKHLVGWMIHMAGACYHCKAYVHWGSECNAATHWVSSTTYLLDYLLQGNFAGRDVFDLWRSALNRMPLTTGASRDVNCTMAHLVPAYRHTGDPQLLLYIHRTGDALMNVAFKDHSSGHYHAAWPRRYYELTRDRRAVERAAAYADVNPNIYSDMLALAWRETGDRRFLDMALNRTFLHGRAMYLNPGDPMDGYSVLRPLAGGSFELMSLPYYLGALSEANIPLAWQPPADRNEPGTIAASPTELAAGVWTLTPGESGRTALQFAAKPNPGYADYVGASLAATLIELSDARGQPILASSIAPGLDRPREAVLVDSAQHPAPWRLVIGSPIRVSAIPSIDAAP